MARQPRQQPIGFYGKFQPTGVDDSAAQRMQALAGLGETVAGVAKQFGVAKAEEAKIEAREAEQFAAKEATKLTAAQLANRKTDGIEQIEQIAIDFAGDPAGYTDAIKVYRDSAIAAAPPDLRPALGLAFAPRIASNFKTINSAFLKSSEKESNQSLDDSISAFTVNLEKLARTGNADLVTTELPDLYMMIDARGENDPLYNVEKAKDDLNNALYEQDVLKDLDNIVEQDGFVAAMTALEEFQDKPLPKGYSQDDLRAFTRSAQEDLSRQKARLNAASTQISDQAKAAVDNFVDALGSGFKVDSTEKARVQALITTDAQQDRVDRAERVAAFSVMSAKNRSAIIASRDTGSLNDLTDWKQMIAKDAEVTKLAEEDGYSLGVAQGLIEEIPFDVNDPNSYFQREEQAKMLSIHTGVVVSPFTDKIATELSESINGMTSEDKAILAMAIGPDSDAWGQIAGKNQGFFAMAASIGDETLMKALFLGQDILKNDPSAKLSQNHIAGNYLETFNDVVGDVYFPEDKRNVLNAVLALYAERGEDYSFSSFKDAIQAVTGGLKEINNYKVQLPRGISTDTFQTYVDRFSAKDVTAFGGAFGYTPEQAAVAIQDGRIVSDGDNRYRVLVNGSVPLTSPNGENFIFSYTESVVSEQAGMAAEQMQKNAELFRKEYGISAPKDTTYNLEAESKKFSESRNRALNKAGFIDFSKRGN